MTLQKKILGVSLALLLIVTVAASIISTFELERYFTHQLVEQLKTEIAEAEYFLQSRNPGEALPAGEYDIISNFAAAANLRLTLIDATGRVLFDSGVPRDSLVFVENHAGRPEIELARTQGFGTNSRVSRTVGRHLYYAAKYYYQPLRRTGFLSSVRYIRVAIPNIYVETVLHDVRWKIFAGGGIALFFIALASYWIAKKLTGPIRELARVAETVRQGNLDAHFIRHSRDELGDLADLLNEMIGKLRDDLKQMRTLQNMRSQFLGNVSHELRTPIFSLQGYLETLLGDRAGDWEQNRVFLEKAYKNSKRLNTLLTDLINISRIESGEMRMSFRYFEVDSWLAQLLSMHDFKANKKGVTVTFVNAGAPSDDVVLGDQERLTQVMLNLIQNAINYNVEGGDVEYGYRRQEDGILVFVADTGPGIAQEHLPRIFERFYRVDKERSREVGGTGLGLAIAKHIIEAHGARIHVESEVGVGTIFSFELKCK